MAELDWKCINKLLESANLALATPLSLHLESSDRINELFKQIQEDYQKFRDGHCNEAIRSDIEHEMNSQFQMALLILSCCAKKNNQVLEPAKPHFSDKELEVYDLLKKFDLLDTYSSDELRKKLISGDTSVKSFFEGYIDLKQSLDHLINHDDARPDIRDYLKKKEKSCNKKFETAFGSDGGRFIVTTSDARQSELHFINRIESKLKANGNIIHFLGTSFTVKIEKGTDLIKRSQKSGSADTNKFRISKILSKNPYIKAVFTEKSISLRKKSFIFYAVFASHIKHYEVNGFDSKPLTFQEITGYLGYIIENSRKNNSHILICIASPTGFEHDDQSSPDNKLFSGCKYPDVSVCFFDLHKNTKFWCKDPTSCALSELCDLESDKEKYARIQEILYPYMDFKLLINESVSLDYCKKFLATHECLDGNLVEKLFFQYAKERKLHVKNIPQIGPVIVKKNRDV